MFETYELNKKGLKEVNDLKIKMAKLLDEVDSTIPRSRYGSIWLTKIEEAMFFGVKAISEKKDNHESVDMY